MSGFSWSDSVISPDKYSGVEARIPLEIKAGVDQSAGLTDRVAFFFLRAVQKP
jgi:hypothetical protein